MATIYDTTRFAGWAKSCRKDECDKCGCFIKQWQWVKLNRLDGFVLCEPCGKFIEITPDARKQAYEGEICTSPTCKVCKD